MTFLRFSLICSTCSISGLTAAPFPFPSPLLLAGWVATGWNVVIGPGVVALVCLGIPFLSSVGAPVSVGGWFCAAAGVGVVASGANAGCWEGSVAVGVGFSRLTGMMTIRFRPLDKAIGVGEGLSWISLSPKFVG